MVGEAGETMTGDIVPHPVDISIEEQQLSNAGTVHGGALSDMLHDAQHIVRAVYHVNIDYFVLLLDGQAAGFMAFLGQRFHDGVSKIAQSDPIAGQTADAGKLKCQSVLQGLLILKCIPQIDQCVHHTQHSAGRQSGFLSQLREADRPTGLAHGLNDLEGPFHGLI